jgi:hypothetical protein
MKVETHNHPTAIAPHPGAGTGAGGEIRDEGATGTGAKPKAGLTGFTVSNLRLPGLAEPWERDYGKPGRIATALDIMVEGPIGGASYNNEFGRPNLTGYFRTYEQDVAGEVRGYHKPIMLAGAWAISRVITFQARLRCEDRIRAAGAAPSFLIGLAAARPPRWRAAPTPSRSTSTPCSAATRKSSAAARKSSTRAGRWEIATPSFPSTTWARAGSPTRCPSSRIRVASARTSSCARFPSRSRA